MNEYDVIIIGGGAAGLMAAHTAALYGKKVLILERNSTPGKKILITGKGRCNITNNCDNNTFIQNVVSNPKFLFASINAFSTADTIDYFERSGVETKTERANRVFPVSDKSADVQRALIKNAKDCGAIINTERVSKILSENGSVNGVLCESGNTYHANSVILATGGKSYPLTGSTGDGYALAEELGHSTKTLVASLVPIITNEYYPKKLQGLSLKNVTLTLHTLSTGKKFVSEPGEMLFTHFGVSGPLVLSASAHIDSSKFEDYKLTIDLKPGLDEKKLDARVLRDFSQNLNKDFFNSLFALLPRKLIPVIVTLSGIPADTKVNAITKEMREKLVYTIKNLTLTVNGFRPIEEAVITSGGIRVNEINPKTMESKLVSGLYFAGEIIDVDAYTGGFNLQIAFATGYVAGQSAASI